MGSEREDRLRLQRIDIGLITLAGSIGLALPHQVMNGEAGRLLVIFTGLIAASVLPTISLMVGNMSATGRSVRSIEELRLEIERIVAALLFIFSCACVIVILLIGLSFEISGSISATPINAQSTASPTGEISAESTTYVSWLTWGVRAFLQAALFAVLALLINRSLIIPKAIKRSLELKAEIAVAEAVRNLNENAPESGATAQHFRKKENFGRTIPLADLRAGNE